MKWGQRPGARQQGMNALSPLIPIPPYGDQVTSPFLMTSIPRCAPLLSTSTSHHLSLRSALLTSLFCFRSQRGPWVKEIANVFHSCKVSFKPTKRKIYCCFSLKAGRSSALERPLNPRLGISNFISKVFYGFTPWMSLK